MHILTIFHLRFLADQACRNRSLKNFPHEFLEPQCHEIYVGEAPVCQILAKKLKSLKAYNILFKYLYQIRN